MIYSSSPKFPFLWLSPSYDTYDHGELWGKLSSKRDHGPVIRILFLTWLPKYHISHCCSHYSLLPLRHSPTLSWNSTYLVTLCLDNTINNHICWKWGLDCRIGLFFHSILLLSQSLPVFPSLIKQRLDLKTVYHAMISRYS